jgi:hypothetical protein
MDERILLNESFKFSQQKQLNELQETAHFRKHTTLKTEQVSFAK